jgi:hypothetical protein
VWQLKAHQRNVIADQRDGRFQVKSVFTYVGHDPAIGFAQLNVDE